MTDENIVHFPDKSVDMEKIIADMKGPEQVGHDVIIDGFVIPNMVMRDCGETIEFVIDKRLLYAFPRDIAYLAAHMAAVAMAIGAGYPHFAHKKCDVFATKVFEFSDPTEIPSA